MKAKQYLTLGLGIVAGFGISVVGVSYASQNLVSNVKQVTPEVAKSIMLNKVPGANILEFSYDGDDKTPKYDGTLIKDNYEYEVDVNAKTGQIIKFEKEAIFTHNSNGNANNASANTQQSTTQNNNASTTRKAYIGESKAKSIMLNKVPGATISKFYLDNDATPEYDGELIKGDYEYDISVDAVTGEIREFSKERIRNYNNPTINNSTSTNNNGSTTNRTYIGESKAKSIMLSNVPGATIRGFHFDNDSTPEYEAELIKDGYEYDISVNALTGEIIEFSKERIEPYDDDRYDYDDDYDDEEDEDQGKVPERRQKREEADQEEDENETKRRGKKERDDKKNPSREQYRKYQEEYEDDDLDDDLSDADDKEIDEILDEYGVDEEDVIEEYLEDYYGENKRKPQKRRKSKNKRKNSASPYQKNR